MNSWWSDLVRGLLLVAFFVSTLLLSAFSERVFLSPDESANFYFAQTLGETGKLFAPVLPDAVTRGDLSTVLLHPRSMVTIGEKILPGSFLGLPILAGAAYKLAGDTGALLVTPFLALLAIIAFRSTVKKLFEDEPLADLSALFLMIHPAFLYFSGRVMLHNVAFLACLIFAGYFAATKPFGVKSRFVREFRRLEFFLSGAMVGAALLIRAAEAPWVVAVFFGLLIAYRNELGWRNMLASLMGFGLLCAAILATNSWVYGGPFVTGYTVHIVAPIVTEITNPESISATAASTPLTISPFGFHPRAVLRNFWSYGIVLYPWMTVPALLGALLLVARRFEKKKVWKTLFVVSLFVGCWLVAYYGSARIQDNPDPNVLTLGNSYVRYWLPIFTLAAPFAAYLMVSAWRYISATEGFGVAKPIQRRAWRGLLILLVLAAGVNSTDLVLNGHDGIIESRAALTSFISKRYSVLSKTELNSIIVVDRADKYLFPKRAVVTPLRHENTYKSLPLFVDHAPTYYFGITFPQSDLDYLNNEKLKLSKLKIELVQTLDEESLYRFSKTK